MKLDADEKELLESVERGEWKSTGAGKKERTRYARYANPPCGWRWLPTDGPRTEFGHTGGHTRADANACLVGTRCATLRGKDVPQRSASACIDYVLLGRASARDVRRRERETPACGSCAGRVDQRRTAPDRPIPLRSFRQGHASPSRTVATGL